MTEGVEMYGFGSQEGGREGGREHQKMSAIERPKSAPNKTFHSPAVTISSRGYQ